MSDYRIMTSGGDTSVRDLRAAIQSVKDSLVLLEQSEHFIDDGTSDIVSLVSDGLSGAGSYKDHYRRDVDEARSDLVGASCALFEGNRRNAARFLSEASEHVSSAWSWWRIYLGASGQGAETAEEGLIGAGLTVTGGVLGGPALALSIALHVAGFSLASLGYDGDEGQEVPLNSMPEGDARQTAKTGSEKTPGPKRESGKAVIIEVTPACILPDQKTGVTADVVHDRCASASNEDENSEYAMILRMVDERGRAAREVGNIGALAEKEKKAIESYKPPTGPDASLNVREYPMRAREELTAEASRALAEWKENPGVVHDYAPFIIDSEFADDQDPDAAERHNIVRSRWDEKIARYQTAMSVYGEDGSRLRNNNSVMAMLFEDFLANYDRDGALLRDFLEGGNGNCEAQTKLVISAIAAGKVKLPDNQVLAVQIFANHAQLVIYDKETHFVWNLMKGKRETAVYAPLYDPHILYLAYLKKLGVHNLSPVSENDLLIYAPMIEGGEMAELKSYDTDDTDTNMQFPKSNVVFSDEPVPRYAQLASPYGNVRRILPGVSLDDMGADREKAEINLNLNHGLDYVSRADYIVFRYKEEADTYNSIPLREGKTEYLMYLAQKAAVEILSSPEMRTCLALFSKPSIARRMYPGVIANSVQSTWRLEGLFDEMFEVYRDPINLGGEIEDHGDKKNFESTMAAGSPLIRLYLRERDRILDLIASRPGWFVAYLDTLSHDRRVTILKEFLELGYFVSALRTLNELRENFAKAIADKRLIGVKVTPRVGFEPTQRAENNVDLPVVENTSVVELEFVDSEQGTGSAAIVRDELGRTDDARLAEVDRPGQKGKKAGNRKLAKARRVRHEISKDTMIDLILVFALAEPVVAGRWNPSLSRRFMRINRDGRYDHDFINAFSNLIYAYPRRSRTVRFEGDRDLVAHYSLCEEVPCSESGSRRNLCIVNLSPDLALIIKDIRKRRDARLAGISLD